MKRKEDARFIQGKGNYVDDVHLPGMVFGHVVRSPYGHARLKSINIEERHEGAGRAGRDHRRGPGRGRPRVDAHPVPRQADGAGHGQGSVSGAGSGVRAWPTTSTPRPTWRSWSRWNTKSCRCWWIRTRRSTPMRPILREDREEKSNHIFHWEVGDRRRRRRRFRRSPVTAKVDAVFQRCHPAPLETCGCVADFNPVTGKLTIWMTSQAPHAHRTLFAIVGGIPEQNIRVISPDIGGGFGNKVPIYPGLRLRGGGVAEARPSGEVD